MLYFARLRCLWFLWSLWCTGPGRDWHAACEEHLPHFLVVQFAGQAKSVPPWVQAPGGFGVRRVLLLCFHSLGGGEKNLFCYSLPFVTQPGSSPPPTQNLTMKGLEGVHLSPLILRNGKSWNLGDSLPRLSQPGGLVITKVSDFKSERPRNACFISPSLLHLQGVGFTWAHRKTSVNALLAFANKVSITLIRITAFS